MVHRSEAAVLGSFALVCVFVLSLPLVTTRIYASDEVESFAWVRSWVFDRDVNFENEYQHFYDSKQVQTASDAFMAGPTNAAGTPAASVAALVTAKLLKAAPTSTGWTYTAATGETTDTGC